MKKLFVLTAIIVFPFGLLAQGNIMLMPFEPLMNATWKAEGKWKDGTPFKQEINYAWSDDNETVELVTKSYLDTSFTTFGVYSQGVIAWDTLTNSIAFKLTETNGNVIDGKVKTKQKTILYEYVLENELGMKTYLTDALIWIKPDKYLLKVGRLEKDEWEDVYLEAYFFKQ